MTNDPTRCAACGADLSGDARFCRLCGAPAGSVPASTERRPTDPPGAGGANRGTKPPIVPFPTAPPARPVTTSKATLPPLGKKRRPLATALAFAGVGLLAAGAVAAGVFFLFVSGDDGDAAGNGPAAGVATATSTSLPATAAGATPSPTPSGTSTPTPAPSPSATPSPGAPRLVNGLQVVDETWVGRVNEAGGLRVRSAPRVEPGNVVGSVAKDTLVNVEGRVLNGQEAEPGKGTVWLIVGPNQYIYAATGYVERVR